MSNYQRAQSDYFARIPHRVFAAFRRGDLTLPEFVVLVVVVGEIDRDRHEEVLATSLRAFSDGCDWRWSLEALRLAVHALKKDNWIEFEEPKQGGRTWRIWLDAAAIDGHLDRLPGQPPSALQAETPSNLEVDLDRLEVPAEESPSPEPDSAASEPASLEVPRAQTRRDETRRDELANLPPVGSLGDGREDAPPPEENKGEPESGTCPDCGQERPLVALNEGEERVCVICVPRRLAVRYGSAFA